MASLCISCIRARVPDVRKREVPISRRPRKGGHTLPRRRLPARNLATASGLTVVPLVQRLVFALLVQALNAASNPPKTSFVAGPHFKTNEASGRIQNQPDLMRLVHFDHHLLLLVVHIERALS